MALLGGGETGGVDRDLGAEQDERRRVGVRVRADEMFRLGAGEHPGDTSADITTLSAVALIPETIHQLGEGSGDAWHGPSRFAYGHGKPESGDRRRHDVEGVAWVTAVGTGVRQEPDDLHELR